MQQQIQREEERPVFRPYGWVPELGDCAEADSVFDVSKGQYGDNTTFKVGTRTLVKNAP